MPPTNSRVTKKRPDGNNKEVFTTEPVILRKKRERRARTSMFTRMHYNAGGYPCSLEMVSAQKYVSWLNLAY